MQGLHGRVLMAVAVAGIATGASAQYAEKPKTPVFYGSLSHPVTLREQRTRYANTPLLAPIRHQVEGARFVKLHFSRFELPRGVTLEVSNPLSTETWRYSATVRDPFTIDKERGDDGRQAFWAMSISGDTAMVRLTGDLAAFDPEIHGFEIDTYLTDIPTTKRKNLSKNLLPVDELETNCGESELYDAICWADSYPDHYERSQPVAMIISSSGKKCTAWRVGRDNRLFTARHCISSQAQLDGAEIWFDYQSSVCGSEDAVPAVKVTGDELLAEHYKLDFTLFTVNDFTRIQGFGNIGLDLRDGDIGEEIFIPQHGLGRPKQIAIESDMNGSGVCEIDDNDIDGFYEGSDIGYMCDTTTSSSGAPVLSGETGRALGLHHWGGCANSAVKFSRIWPEVSEYFNGVVPSGNANGDWAEPNRAPVARISTECEGLSCAFDASGSSDVDGSIAEWLWLLEGETVIDERFEHEFDVAGEYEIELTVIDDEGASTSRRETVAVSEPNEAPEARFSSTCVQDACTFDAGGSRDNDGSIAEWQWSLGDGNEATGEIVEHRFDEEGDYWVSLTVSDNDGAENSTGHSVTISIPNQEPRARIAVSCEKLSCSVDASDSSDPDGEIVAWTWDFGDGGQASGSSAQHEYGEAGSYRIELTVEDDEGALDSTSFTVEASNSNVEPSARFEWACSEGRCVFDATASSDPDGEIASWSWSFGDGERASGAQVEHNYDADGDYLVTLRITDNGGMADSSRKSLTIRLPEPENEPLASFSVDCDGRECLLDAGSSTAADGSITSYDWSFGDGSTGTGSAVSHRYDEDGNYTVTLKVTDGKKDSGVSRRIVRVESERGMTLNAEWVSTKRQLTAVLNWTARESGRIEVYRNDRLLTTVMNQGFYQDRYLKAAGTLVRYRICEPTSGLCSQTVKLRSPKT
ncbi:MAG: PKD domain-containing protein [Xanthomonadales bacterium]|nr:PKD domain-containing protein [Gammaproteobacteria bacterium]NNL05333.1 PKD domain-containing protein [Xanthomonadales bacterium]